MKSYKDIIKEMTTDQVISVLQSLGSDNYKTDNEGNLIFQSICHNSNSYKLYYFIASKSFYCFRDSESYNIFSLVMVVNHCDFSEAYKYVCNILGIDTGNSAKQGIVFHDTAHIKEDWDLLNKYVDNTVPFEIIEDKPVPDTTLDYFTDIYWEGWIKDHIGIEAMQKFNIKYDVLNNCIIIPHYDKDNNLVGIRCRNLDPNAFAKYCPVQINDKWYTHALGNHLYGLNHNKDIIQKLGKAMICESEKSVLQCETYYPNNNFTVACCGSNISKKQIDLLVDAGVRTVILGFDFDYINADYNETDFLRYKDHLLKKAKKLMPYFNVQALVDGDPRLCGFKDSPTDNGKEILEKLLDNKISITEQTIINELGDNYGKN